MIEIPLKVLNRLRLGREVATEAPTLVEGERVWILVTPITKQNAPWVSDSKWEGAEARLSDDNSPSILGYRIARIELPSEMIERIRDDDLPRRAVSVEQMTVREENQIAPALSLYLQDATSLRHPDNVADLSLVLFRLGPI